MIKKVILTGILGLLYVPILAQSIVNYESYWDNYLIRNITRDDGLFRDEVYDTYQDTSGFIWIANFSYLFKYDGIKLIPFEEGADFIGNIKEFGENRNHEMSFLDVEIGLRTKIGDSLKTQKEEIGLEMNSLISMSYNKGDSLFIGDELDGVNILYNDTVIARFDSTNGLAGNIVYKIITDQKNRTWITTDRGVSVFEKGKIKNLSKKDGLPDITVNAIVENYNGEIWLGTETNGIVVFENYDPIRYYKTSNGLTDNSIEYMEKNPADSSIWIGFTNKGLDRFKSGSFENINSEKGLVSDFINSIRFDKSGIGYVGTEYGLSIFVPRVIDVVDEKTNGFPLAETFSVDQDSSGRIFVGTISEGLMSYKDGNWENTRFSKTRSNESMSVFKVEDKSSLFMVSSELGLMVYQDENVLQSKNSGSGLLSDYIVCLEIDTEKNLWIGTWDGFNIINENWEITDSLSIGNPVPGDKCLNMVADKEGDIWIATLNNGLFEMRGKEVISKYNTSNGLLHNRVYGLLSDSKGEIWASSLDFGLYRITKDGLKVYPGLPDNFVSITEDDFGNFWFSSNGYLAHVERADLDKYDSGEIKTIPFQKFTQDDGFPASRVNYGNSSLTKKISSGEILVTAKRGLVVVDPEKAKLADEFFFPYIESFLIDEEKIPLDKKIILQPSQKKIEISYSALNIRAPKKTKFRVMLEGIDEDWNYVEDRTTAYYDYLPDGNYILHVSAIGPNGVWSDKTDFVSFTVLPPYYKTWWFISLCLLGFVAMGAGGVQLRSNLKLRELNQELQTQQKIQKERERISRELHDNVGSQITNLITGIEISNLHVKKNQQDQALSLLENLDSDARSAMTDLRETIWLLDKEKVQFGIFLDHLKGFVKRQEHYLKGLKVDIRSDIDPEKMLNPTQSLNVTRIIQEALNNARKYAKASSFEITFVQKQNQILITLVDNGLGMSSENNLEQGNGLKNMRERIEEIGGAIIIKSSIDNGTSITLEI